MSGVRDVTVIGAGLSGLATAWYLTDAGARVHVIEAADRPGGLIQSPRLPEGLVETAARAFTASERVTALFSAVGLEPIAPREQSKRRYIYRDGRPRRWPLSVAESASMAARAGLAWIRRDMRPHDDETVTVWGRRVLGSPATTWLIAPVLQGIYASPPDELSAAAIFGPSRRSTRGKLAAPAGGMGELMDRLHARLLERGATFTFGTPWSCIDANAPAVVCTNAPVAATLIAPHAPALSREIASIRMVSLRPVTAFYAPHAADLRGFGILFPRSAGIQALGALFNCDIFDGRAGRGDLRSETWIYGDLSPEKLPRDEAEMRTRLAADRRVLTGRDESPIAIHMTPQASLLPVYDQAVLRAQKALTDLPPWLALTGNYLGRLGVSGILETAAESAARLMR
jgi:oxygen-dependent protoporphyrinogen oxidase